MSQEELPNDDRFEDLVRMLQALQAFAPESTMERLRRRMRTVQLGRDLFEKQVYGFWIVLHNLLTVAFRYFATPAHVRSKRMAVRRRS